MKKILSTLLFFTLFLFSNSYEIAWSEVKKFEEMSLPKSALKKIESIYSQAREEKNEQQLIKALMRKKHYLLQLSDNGYIEVIKEIEEAIKESPKETTRSILNSILAEMYAQYLDKNYYKISQRSTLKTANSKDITTWSRDKFIEKSSQLYLKSLDENTQKTDIDAYQMILSKGKNIEGFFPTLYDFLAYRALNHFKNERYYLTQPQNTFLIQDKIAFSCVYNFIAHDFKTTNKNSFKYQSLLIYKKLLELHTLDGHIQALNHANLERLTFVYQHFESAQKEDYYRDSLEKLIVNNPNSEALFYLTQYYLKQNNGMKALISAKQGIKSSNKYLVYQCQKIKDNIERKTLQFQVEETNLPHENILSKISYQNIHKIFVQVLKPTKEEFEKLKSIKFNKKQSYLNSLSIINSFEVNLPKIDDYKQHSTEISLGTYDDIGKYIFILSTNKVFNEESIYKIANISNLSYFIKENKKVLVLHRKTGQPLANVKASFYEHTYNNKTNRDEKKLHSSTKSSADGYIQLPKLNNGYSMTLTYKNNILEHRNHIYSLDYGNNSYHQEKKIVHFFIDRAIYRPSQTIYFKGLAIQTSNLNTPKVLSKREIVVTFFNTSRQKIERKRFITDEFGTFNGTFIAPKSGLLGTMYLEADIGGRKDIQVEEYKRPKFEVTFQQLDNAYKLGDKVSLSGKAKTFAGNPINGATVNYRVERRTSFPWLCYWQKKPHSGVKQITLGRTKTDNKGVFKIDFKALIDKSLSKEDKATYSYHISAHVIDSTGESHSNSKIITLGYVALAIDMEIKKELSIDGNQTLTLSTTNLDGKFQPLKGKIIVEQIIQDPKIYRTRYWKEAEKTLYNKEEFSKLFKEYRYRSEEEKKIKVKSLNFDTESSKIIDLNLLEQGVYLLTLKTTDDHGVEVSKEKKITLYDLKSNQPVTPTYLWQKSDKETYEVNTQATLILKSSLKKLPILLSIYRQNKLFKEKWINVQGLTKELIKIAKTDKGNITYIITFIQNNRTYSQHGVLNVPWNNELKVEYLTFRDKLKPNEKEQWKIKISGKNREKVMAQMVATMYDASLDAFSTNSFSIGSIFPHYYSSYNVWNPQNFYAKSAQNRWQNSQKNTLRRLYPDLKWLRYNPNYNNEGDILYSTEAMIVPIMAVNERGSTLHSFGGVKSLSIQQDSHSNQTTKPLKIRKNFQETMFFKPNLQTDKEGNIIINFKTNDALTRWNFLGFIHTKDLKTAITKKTITTSKELMVVSNLPRFFREKDTITLSAKIVNMSEKDLKGECELQLLDPLTEQPIYNQKFKKVFYIKRGESTVVNFTLKVPDSDRVSAIKHTLIARTSTHSDAEQVIKPVLSNRVFITQSRVLSIRGEREKIFTLKSLQENNSTSLKHHKLTVEFTSNPAWYAIQSLPYLMEYEHECSEQLFSRYYANALAQKVTHSSPKIKNIFDTWRKEGKLKSKLSTNQALKSVLLEETPWVLEAQSQEEQQKNIALLFDLHRVASQQKEALKKLKERQLSSGGWSWFGGDRASWYITQYIVEGIGHLKALGITTKEKKMVKKAISYIDKEAVNTYKQLQREVEGGYRSFKDDNLNSMMVHYLYARSFYKQKMGKKTRVAYKYYLKQAQRYWKDKGLYEQGMITLALHRHHKETKYIVASLKEHALHSNEFGMYFKYTNGYYWNELPIETHALMIEVFETVAKDKKAVEDLKTWLLKQRQTTHWKTTKATSSAIYALLSNSNWLTKSKLVEISFETEKEYQPKLKEAQSKAIKGLGYYKVSYDKNEFDPSMATIKVKNPNKSIAWGSLYWQYFEEMDKVKSFKETPLTIDKKLFLIEQTTKGEQLSPITDQDLKVGDKVKVRIVIKVDRNMEYVMLKDSRASAFEPLNVISQYKYQDGLGYYQSTKDNATYFFIDYLNKGTYVFEYLLVVTHKGEFSNGITSMESMYAPEFKSHSEGIRVKIN